MKNCTKSCSCKDCPNKCEDYLYWLKSQGEKDEK